MPPSLSACHPPPRGADGSPPGAPRGPPASVVQQYSRVVSHERCACLGILFRFVLFRFGSVRFGSVRFGFVVLAWSCVLLVRFACLGSSFGPRSRRGSVIFVSVWVRIGNGTRRRAQPMVRRVELAPSTLSCLVLGCGCVMTRGC